MIAFAGPRVVEQTIRQKLPAGAQRSEFVLEHGLIDCIVDRSELNAKIVSLLRFFHLSKQKNTQVLHKSKDLNEKLEEMIQTAETHSKGVEECKK